MPVKRLLRALSIIIGLLLLSVVVLYYGSLQWLFNQWMTDKLYSHGVIVPLISLYLIWLKREQFVHLIEKPRYVLGSALILISCIILLVGRVGAIIQFEAISLLLMLPALVLFVLGSSWFACLWVPLGYLVFMVPVIDPFVEQIQFPFQLISAKIAALSLKLLGFTLYREGIYLHFSNIVIEVARECSGIHFLFSVFAIGVPLVYITQKSWFKALIVLFSGFIAVILINSARVALASYMGHVHGADVLHGPGHIFRGWFVAQVGWVAIFLINWIVCKFPSRSEYRLFEKWRSTSSSQDKLSRAGKSATLPAGIALSIMLAMIIYLNAFAIARPLPPKQDLATFPVVLNTLVGKDRNWLNDESLLRAME